MNFQNLFVSTSNGKIIIVDIKTANTENILKIDNQNISGPFVVNKFLYLIKNKSIIRLN